MKQILLALAIFTLSGCFKSTPKPADAAAAQSNKQSSVSHVASTVEIQSALARSGVTITPDGKMGPQTKTALKTFQQRNGLKVTGIADAPTLTKLGL